MLFLQVEKKREERSVLNVYASNSKTVKYAWQKPKKMERRDNSTILETSTLLLNN